MVASFLNDFDLEGFADIIGYGFFFEFVWIAIAKHPGLNGLDGFATNLRDFAEDLVGSGLIAGVPKFPKFHFFHCNSDFIYNFVCNCDCKSILYFDTSNYILIFIFILNYNKMTYNDLSFLVKEKGLSIKSLAKNIGMTSTGMKKAFEEKTLQWKKMESLCEIFGITPNQFMSWPSDVQMGNGNYASNISGGNTQNSNDSIKAMMEQLKEKDKQISRLLSLLEKANLHTQSGNGQASLAAEAPVSYKNGKGKK